MVTGGTTPVTGMLGGLMPLLHRRPDQRRLLLDDPEGILTRSRSCCGSPRRCRGWRAQTTRDVTIGDTTIPAGRRVLLLYGLANRDERQYGPTPNSMSLSGRATSDLSQPRRPPLPGCGRGPMQCRVALTELLAWRLD